MKRFKTFYKEEKLKEQIYQEVQEGLKDKLKFAAIGGLSALPVVAGYAAGRFHPTNPVTLHDAGPKAVEQQTPTGVNKPGDDDPYGGRFHEIVDMTGKFEGGHFDGKTSNTHADPIHGWNIPTNAGQTKVGLTDRQHSYLKSKGINPDDVFKQGGSLHIDDANHLRRLRMEDDRPHLQELYPDFDSHPHHVKSILHDLIYNLGKKGLSKFKKFNAAINNKDYKGSAPELKNSLYYKQTGNRAKTHVQTLLDL